MGRVARQFDDPLAEAFRKLRDHERAIQRIRSKGVSLSVRSTSTQLFLQAGDGDVWISADDNNIHYQVGGAEYKIVGVLV